MHGLRILVISNKPQVKDAIRGVCADMGIYTVSETDAAKVGWRSIVLANAKKKQFDIVFYDRDYSDDFDLLAMCKATESFNDIKFVLVLPETSAEPIFDESIDTLTYMVAPVSFNKVRNRLKRLKFDVPKYKVA